MPSVNLRNGEQFYEVHGAGHPVVLIHGAWASHEWWQWQIEDLSRSYRVFTPDLRGHGRSCPIHGTYSIEGFVDDLHQFLKGLEIERVALVGWSLGGVISMKYCLAQPDLVQALVLIGVGTRFGSTLKARIVSAYAGNLLRLMSTFSAPRKYDFNAPEESLDSAELFYREARNMLSPGTSEETVRRLASTMARTSFKNFLQVAKSIWRWKAGNELAAIRTPTLIMVGADDRVTPPEHSRRLHALVPESRLMVVEGAGHYVAMERPNLVNSTILEFLADSRYGLPRNSV